MTKRLIASAFIALSFAIAAAPAADAKKKPKPVHSKSISAQLQQSTFPARCASPRPC